MNIKEGDLLEKMVLSAEIDALLRKFVEQSSFSKNGAVITDLDGTAVHEDKGRIYIPKPVQYALKELYELGRPLILNSIRFPLSVLRTFGREWYSISNVPIPTVSLNGSQIGFVTKSEANEMSFEEVDSFPLTSEEIDAVFVVVNDLLEKGVKNILVFYYPRDWRIGEVIWTPSPENILHVKEKYRSASSVTAVEFGKLREQLDAEEICMIFLLIDIAKDQLMSYQHTKRSNFFTHKGVDKLSGAKEISNKLGIDLTNSLAAGDTEMDKFLSGAGLAIHVGNIELQFAGLYGTIKIQNSYELGELLFRTAEILREHTQ